MTAIIFRFIDNSPIIVIKSIPNIINNTNSKYNDSNRSANEPIESKSIADKADV